MSEKANRFEQAWAEAVAKVWKEGSGEFRTMLLRDPKAAFAELGAQIPQGVDVRVIESSRSQVYFVLPPKPGELKDISDENLDELYRACPGTVCQ